MLVCLRRRRFIAAIVFIAVVLVLTPVRAVDGLPEASAVLNARAASRKIRQQMAT